MSYPEAMNSYGADGSQQTEVGSESAFRSAGGDGGGGLGARRLFPSVGDHSQEKETCGFPWGKRAF